MLISHIHLLFSKKYADKLFSTFAISKSEIAHGTIKTSPTSILGAYGDTSFTCESSIFDDRIEYTWTYEPTYPWCNDQNTPISGTYKYTFGLNSCSGGSVVCPGI